MKRFVLLVSLAATFGFLALALATSPASGSISASGNPEDGKQGVAVNTSSENLGHALRAMPDFDGMNPDRWSGQWTRPKSAIRGVRIHVHPGREYGPFVQ